MLGNIYNNYKMSLSEIQAVLKWQYIGKNLPWD